MVNGVKSAKQGLKSASDFEQWLNEIYLFAHETQAELHEIAGALKMALASDSLGDLNERSKLSLAYQSESPGETGGQSIDEPATDGDAQMARLQRKLAQQIKSSQISSKSIKALGPGSRSEVPTVRSGAVAPPPTEQDRLNHSF